MQYSRLRFLIIPVLVFGALIYALPKTEDRNQGTQSGQSQAGQRSPAGGRIVLDETFESYSACDAAARVVAKELTGSGVRTALASRNALAGTTVYKVYYPDASGQLSCRQGRLVNEIVEQR